jgi:PTS system galactitol-specific IIB component
MKTVIVACGGGIATSTVLVSKIDELLIANKIEHKIIQCQIIEIKNFYDQADLIVAATPIRDRVKIPKVIATSYLTGMGVEQTNQQILDALRD